MVFLTSSFVAVVLALTSPVFAHIGKALLLSAFTSHADIHITSHLG